MGDGKSDFVRKLPKALLVVIFSPLILLFLVIALFGMLIHKLKDPTRKKAYEESPYFRDLGVPYESWLPYRDSVLFYNEAKRQGRENFRLIHQADDGLDYLLFDNTIFLFEPDCLDGVFYDDPAGEWMVNLDGDIKPLAEEWNACKSQIENNRAGMPVLMLLKDEHLFPREGGTNTETDHCARDLLPAYVRVVANYMDILD